MKVGAPSSITGYLCSEYYAVALAGPALSFTLDLALVFLLTWPPAAACCFFLRTTTAVVIMPARAQAADMMAIIPLISHLL